MSLTRRKIRKSALACLSLTLCATLSAGALLANFDINNSAGGSTAESLSFTDVTREYDSASLSAQNFNSSVLAAPKAAYETRSVIVTLESDSLLQAKSTGQTVAEYAESSVGFRTLRAIDEDQKNFLNKLKARKIDYKLNYSYSSITNAVSIEIDTSYVSEIKAMAGVKSVVIGRTYLVPETVTASTDSNGAVVNDSFVYRTGIYDSSDYSSYSWGTGAGTVVAVIDTGLDYTHTAFQTLPKDPSFSESYIESVLGKTTALKMMASQGASLSVNDVYVSQKVPFAFDYADYDTDVYPSYSNHGTHVAGIIGGYSEEGYDLKVGNTVTHVDDEYFLGVAPDAQLVICKTFTDNLDSSSLGGAESEAIMAALEDCVNLGVDVINMSLGSTAGFTTTDDGDDEGEMYDVIFKDIQKAGISLICAASNDYSAGFGSVYGTNLASNPDSATVGSPSTYYAAMSVASISGQKSEYMLDEENNSVFFQNASDGNAVEYDFISEMLSEEMLGDEAGEEHTFEYVVVGTGQATNYYGNIRSLVSGRIALIQRGSNTFQQKVELAKRYGAIAAIVYNNVSGTIRMTLGDLAEEDYIPAISITKDAGEKLVSIAKNGTSGIVGKITVSSKLSAGPFMSSFSSWGPTPDLKIKPEITAHGGEINSTVPGGYAVQSGTSMACPNMAGLTALVRNYVKSLPISAGYEDDPSKIISITNQLIMSTATTAFDEDGLAYSPRKQGAGLANLDNIVNTYAYISTKSGDSYYYDQKDGRPKIEMGDDKKKTGVYQFNFHVNNFNTTNSLTFIPEALFMTETIASDGITVKEQAYMLDDINPVFQIGSTVVSEVVVPANGSVDLKVTLTLSDAEKKYIDDNFSNGMYVEGFIKLVSDKDKNGDAQCDLTLPFLGFYGDWEQAPMLDIDAYELAKKTQDTSLDEEEKPSETVWATQAYASYWNDDFVIPIGSYLYNQDPDPTNIQIYATMEHNAISMFNEYYNEDGIGNYLTTYEFRCVYAGLLRNARRVNYKLYDNITGELVKEGNVNRVSKAYANGGSSVPAYVELRLSAEELGLVANGYYRFDFEFLFNSDSEPSEDNTFSFDFYVDYEAPVLQDARLRYYNYKDGNKDKQRIYLDLDVFDNQYAQAVLLCYRDVVNGEVTLNLATDYATPVRNANRNGVTTVSIEVTDFWDEYKDNLFVQIDDYALNHSNYYLGSVNGALNSVNSALNKTVLPDTFTVPESEKHITLNINEAHKINLEYDGAADIANFIMTVGGSATSNNYIAVKNGEVVGLNTTNGRETYLNISNGKGFSATIGVTVTNTVVNISNPSFNFGVIRSSNEALKSTSSASSPVNVYAGEDIQMSIVPDPWYFPMDNVQIKWSASGSALTVSESGLVHTVNKGVSTVSATITVGNVNYVKNFYFSVADPFTISNNALTKYHGDGETIDGQDGVVIIPESKNIFSISEEAFKDNTKITKVVIPKTVTSIGKKAFYGCTNLEGVYFVNDTGTYVKGNTELEYTDDGFVAESAMTLIERNAFEGCTSLEVLDLRNVKVITIAREAFKDCVNLKTIEKSTAIGTAYDRAFLGCKSLTEIDISELHSAGTNVFSGCEALQTVITNRYTAIGERMFTNLTYYYQVYDYNTGEWGTYNTVYPACNKITEVEIKTPNVGAYAFANCTGLNKVTFSDPTAAGDLEFAIGAYAFSGCENLATLNFNSFTIRSIGAGAFGDTKLSIGSSLFSSDGKTLLLYTGSGSYSVPTTVTKIAPYAFANSSVTSVTIPSSVTEIGEGAFANSGLSSITINANITSIPAYAFYNTKLTSITLPATVTSVGDYAFARNAALEYFTYNPTSSAQFENGVFSGCTALAEISLNANIVKLGDRTFDGCTSLREVTLPSLVNTVDFTALGEYTFWNTPKLESVTFGSASNTTGNYTFAANSSSDRLNFTTVSIGSAVETIGDFTFYNCAGLTSIDLKNATATGYASFAGCTALTTFAGNGLSKLVNIGDYSFADCVALATLELTAAKTIGEGAFAISSGTKAYTSISIPNAESLGAFAFMGGREATVEIPVKLTSIGDGAFAASTKLTSFTVAGGNSTFFVEDGVLYRYVDDAINGTTGKVILVAFPSAKTVGTVEGEKVYTLNENTVKVAGSAFRGLTGGVTKVVLPYGLKSIGAAAFYDSKITKYEFKGVTAPALETVNSEFVDEVMADDTSYRGIYYANFESYFIFYAGYTNLVTPAQLTIYRPDNGTGYDNYVFANFFGACVMTGIAKSEATNEFITLVSGFYSAQEISGWSPDKAGSPTKAEVEAFSESVKKAHENYNVFASDATQLAFVDSSLIEKFNNIETALRSVKKAYNIPVSITGLTYTGNFKSVYKVGERFDISGLQVIIVYDDYSTEYADMSKVTYDLHDALTRLDNVITLTYEGYTVRVGITVNEGNGEGEASGCGGGCGTTSSITGTMMFTFTALGLMFILSTVIRKKNRGIR